MKPLATIALTALIGAVLCPVCAAERDERAACSPREEALLPREGTFLPREGALAFPRVETIETIEKVDTVENLETLEKIDSLGKSLSPALVTAWRLPAQLTAAVPVQQLDTAALRRRGVTDIGDALRRFAGVNLRDYGGAGGLKSVSVRGLGAAHTVVTFDGLPLSDIQGGQTDLGQFRTDQLAAIALTVADAQPLLTPVATLTAASVSLLSLRPDTARRHLSAGLRGGSFTTVNPSFYASTPLGRSSALSLGTDFYFGENDYPFTVENGVATHREHRQNSRMQTWTAEANFAADGRWGSWDAKAYYHNNHRRLPGIVHLYTTEAHERLVEQTALAQLRWNHRVRRWSLMAAAKFNFQESLYTDKSPRYVFSENEQSYWNRTWYATAGAAYDLKPFSLAYATDLRYEALNSNLSSVGSPSRTSWLQSLSLRYDLRTLTLTARVAYHDYQNRRHTAEPLRNAYRFTPMVSAAWTACNSRRLRLQLRGFYQELFRVPTFTEAYYYHYGAATLQPELTRQVGVGTTLLIRGNAATAQEGSVSQQEGFPLKQKGDASPRGFESLALTLDAYHNLVSQRIVSVPYNLFVWRTTNMGHVRARGIDVTLDARFRPARRHRLFLAANYSLTDVRDRTDRSNSSYNVRLAYTPLHSGSVALTWENPLCGFVVHTTFASSRWGTNEHTLTTELPGYAETGFTLYRQLRPCRGLTLDLRADLLNAFDKEYAVIRRYPMAGRAWQLSIKANF